jgi:pimeloyl-ACP methyl ester carboxylesterase
MRFDEAVFLAFAREITAPVLLVDGGPTGLAFPGLEARADALRRVHARVSLADAGHMMHWTRPAEFAAAVLAFFREVAP